MNWNKIKEQYPKSWGMLISKMGWPENNEGWKWYKNFDMGVSEADNLGAQEDRDLYDFFDEKNLNIKITPEYYKDGRNWLWQILIYSPKEEFNYYVGTFQYGDNGEYRTRLKAEKAAFEMAFEILNNKL
jgi:hypothetical protein